MSVQFHVRSTCILFSDFLYMSKIDFTSEILCCTIETAAETIRVLNPFSLLICALLSCFYCVQIFHSEFVSFWGAQCVHVCGQRRACSSKCDCYRQVTNGRKTQHKATRTAPVHLGHWLSKSLCGVLWWRSCRLTLELKTHKSASHIQGHQALIQERLI